MNSLRIGDCDIDIIPIIKGLVSEKEENSYSDVALLLQLIMDAAAAFAKRQYNISYDYKGEEIPRYRYGYHR